MPHNSRKRGPIDFNNAFAILFVGELQKKMVLDLPPHLKCVAALPREI